MFVPWKFVLWKNGKFHQARVIPISEIDATAYGWILVKTYTAQMLRSLIATIAVASLASCTQAQIEAGRFANTAGEVRNKLLACRSKIDASPQIFISLRS
jgi:hypothetical protein